MMAFTEDHNDWNSSVSEVSWIMWDFGKSDLLIWPFVTFVNSTVAFFAIPYTTIYKH